MDGRRWRSRGRRKVPTDPGRADAQLLGELEASCARARELAGPWLACGPGCDECCHGPFPITRLDLRRLRRGLAELRRREPERAAALVDRARRAVATLRPGFPGDPDTGRLDLDESRLDAFFERHGALACPALEPGSGRCELYAWRPVSCRTYGPPVRFGEDPSPPCRLCFVGAPVAEIERCRVEPDPDGIEAVTLARAGVAAGEDWETLIAHALAGLLPAGEGSGDPV